jgi:hypothetical protein
LNTAGKLLGRLLDVIYRTYAVGALMGGLEGCKPFKDHPFLVVLAAKPAIPPEN